MLFHLKRHAEVCLWFLFGLVRVFLFVCIISIFNISVSKSTALAETDTGVSSASGILDVGYISSPNCRHRDPSQPQTLQIPVNSAKCSHIFNTGSFPYFFARTKKNEKMHFL